tara:strand:+ start:883 stop:1095 length:213 start_codon:yes stop_codon:yes gene_type:complete
MSNTNKYNNHSPYGYPDANPNHPQFGTDKVLADKLVGGKRKKMFDEAGLYVKAAYHDDEGHRHGCDCNII